MKKYLKRFAKFIVTGKNQPIVKINIYQKTPNNMFDGKKFIITGGGSGLGFYIAKK